MGDGDGDKGRGGRERMKELGGEREMRWEGIGRRRGRGVLKHNEVNKNIAL